VLQVTDTVFPLPPAPPPPSPFPSPLPPLPPQPPPPPPAAARAVAACANLTHRFDASTYVSGASSVPDVSSATSPVPLSLPGASSYSAAQGAFVLSGGQNASFGSVVLGSAAGFSAAVMVRIDPLPVANPYGSPTSFLFLRGVDPTKAVQLSVSAGSPSALYLSIKVLDVKSTVPLAGICTQSTFWTTTQQTLGTTFLSASGSVTLGQWMFVVLTVSSTGASAVYLNGALAAPLVTQYVTYTNPFVLSGAGPVTGQDASGCLQFGPHVPATAALNISTATFSSNFVGADPTASAYAAAPAYSMAFADVQLYNVPLNAAQVAAMNSGVAASLVAQAAPPTRCRRTTLRPVRLYLPRRPCLR
jgi:hypothetical protein